jgi:subtilisin family serine protease
MRPFRFYLPASLVLFGACGKGNPNSQNKPVTERISALQSNKQGKTAEPQNENYQLKYVVKFDTPEEAELHARQVHASGAKVENIAGESTIQKVEGTPEQLKNVTISDATRIARNGFLNRFSSRMSNRKVTLKEIREGLQEGSLAQSVLTARSVIGVDELAKRFPAADGRHAKVAVFDTGIDFGVQGLSESNGPEKKLTGFFDYSGFGVTAVTRDQSNELKKAVIVNGSELHISDDLGIKVILGTGILNEAKMASDYLSIQSEVDINENGKVDTFPFVLGENADGKLAVYIDANLDGKLSNRAQEELTDYNSTQKYIDLSHTTPAGANPLAVSIRQSGEVQFHSVRSGHGTGCALIIAGENYANGKLEGMAPKSQLVSFVLDATGQDVYTMDQFISMFLMAKQQNVDAINVSWGFATADLDSSRFLADFLDSDIASHGIVIGIATGNEGPTVGSALADDYIPHHGFGLGAMVTENQARNLHRWSGDVRDSVVWYSSFGPTQGARQMPDFISPLMTLVRDRRADTDTNFYVFSGTSSATPAFIGATAALVSALKEAGEVKISPRILKLALENSATQLPEELAMRQGAGIPNVNKAFDLYLSLHSEWKAAQADPQKKTPFPYEMRAEVPMENETAMGEGIAIVGKRTSVPVNIKLTPETLEMLDGSTFIETFRIEHQGTFLSTPQIAIAQARGGNFNVTFSQEALSVPGIYQDTLLLRREKDGIILLRIPVVVTIPSQPQHENLIAEINSSLEADKILRFPIKLEKQGALRFEGVVQNAKGASNSRVAFAIRSQKGNEIFSHIERNPRNIHPLSLTTETLPAGHYELTVTSYFGQPAVLKPLQLMGAFRTALVQPHATQRDGINVTLALKASEAVSIDKATLTLTESRQTISLNRNLQAPRPGYYGAFALAGSATNLKIRLKQKALNAALDRMLHMELALVDETSGSTLYRGWQNIPKDNEPLLFISLDKPAAQVKVIAYPNIVNWEQIQTTQLELDIDTPLIKMMKSDAKEKPGALNPSQLTQVMFAFEEDIAPQSSGILELFDANGLKMESIPVLIE